MSVDGRASYAHGVLKFVELSGILILDWSALEDNLIDRDLDKKRFVRYNKGCSNRNRIT